MLLLASAFVGAAVLFLPTAIHDHADPDVPQFLNDGSRRLHTENGLSIIVPPQWTYLPNNAGALHLYPMTLLASRGRATMSLTRLTGKPDLIDHKKTRFADCDAWESMHIARKHSLDDGALSVYRTYIQHETGWLAFTYTIPHETETLPESVRRYIETIEIEDGKDKNP